MSEFVRPTSPVLDGGSPFIDGGHPFGRDVVHRGDGDSVEPELGIEGERDGAGVDDCLACMEFAVEDGRIGGPAVLDAAGDALSDGLATLMMRRAQYLDDGGAVGPMTSLMDL